MKRTYIATTQEAKALHDGTQTAIITKMRVQPTHDMFIIRKAELIHIQPDGFVDCGSENIPIPYAIGQEVVVRESWIDPLSWDGELGETPDVKWNSPATMPVSAARTRFRIVSCEAVRVRDDIGYSNAVSLLEFDYSEGQQFKNYDKDWSRYDNSQFQFGDYRDSWQSYIIHKLGQSAWDNNDYIFYYKIEKI